ncbi:MAG: hypothetical protein ACRDL7_05015, partial [Gaiellaceae bacterium]
KTQGDIDTCASSKLISDSAANISVLGINWCIIEKSLRTIDIIGFADDLQRKNLSIVNALTKTYLPNGKAILIQINEAAYLGTGDSLLSKIQVGSYGIHVDDDPYFGSGYILSNEYIGDDLPLTMESGMVFLAIECPTEDDLENLSVLVLTDNVAWNPTELSVPQGFAQSIRGEIEEKKDDMIGEIALRMGITNKEIIKKTLKCTTWMGRLDPRVPLRRHIKARLPHMGLVRLLEPVAMDTVFPSDTEKIPDYSGNTCAQVFVGMESSYVFVVLMKAEREGPGALQDFIRYVGCPLRLHNDRSKMELNLKIKKICRDAYIPQSTTEAYHPWQNPAERRIQEIKKAAEYFMDSTSADTKAWGFALLHAVWCLNRVATKSLGYITPYEYAIGETPDISALQFMFWQPLFYLDPLSRFPQPTERGGRFLGIAEYVGDAMTYWILGENEQVIARSCVRAVDDNVRVNWRAKEKIPKGILKDDEHCRWTK